jgi:hypothetical protein
VEVGGAALLGAGEEGFDESGGVGHRGHCTGDVAARRRFQPRSGGREEERE